MSARPLYSLTEEKAEPHNKSSQKGNHVSEMGTNSEGQRSTGKSRNLSRKLKQRISLESLVPFSSSSPASSSCSSSFSSLDTNKAAKLEPFLSTQIAFHRTQQTSSCQLNQKSVTTQNAIIEPTNREARALLVKNAGRKKALGRPLIYVDSPRPKQPPNKLLEAARKFNEEDDSLKLSALKTAHRLSYDGTESRDKSKSSRKVKELPPRLSLDSRTRSHKGNGDFDQWKEEGDFKRPSAVVTKLMGLDGFPDSMSNTKHRPEIPGCQRTSYVEYISPRLQAVDLTRKPDSSSMLETAPMSDSSVYGETERRLTKLVVKISQKTEVKDPNSNFASQKINNSPFKQNPKLGSPRKLRTDMGSSPSISTNSLKSYKSPVVILRPAELVGKVGRHKVHAGQPTFNRRDPVSKKTAKDLTSINTHLRYAYSHPFCSADEKKEKQPHTTSPTSHSRRTRRQSHRHKIESSSLKIQHNSRPSSFHHKSKAFSTHVDVELKSVDCVDGSKQKNPFTGTSKSVPMSELVTVGSEQPSPVSVLNSTLYWDDPPSQFCLLNFLGIDHRNLIKTDAELIHMLPTQSSNSTEPFISQINQKRLEKIQHNQEVTVINKESFTTESAHLCKREKPLCSYIFEVMMASGLLYDLHSGLLTYQLHSPGHLINPDLFLTLEEIKAGKLSLIDEQSQKIAEPESESVKKRQRKLIFDTVNEILVGKLMVEGPPKGLISLRSKVGGPKSRGQQLLTELCSQVDQLQYTLPNNLRYILQEDLMHQTKNWASYETEVAESVVLSIERLIFKDLVTEVLSFKTSLQGRSGGPCRQLFST